MDDETREGVIPDGEEGLRLRQADDQEGAEEGGQVVPAQEGGPPAGAPAKPGKLRMPSARELAARPEMTRDKARSVIMKLLPDMLAIKAAAAYSGDHKAAGDLINKIIPDMRAVDPDSGGGIQIVINQKVYQPKTASQTPTPENTGPVVAGPAVHIEIHQKKDEEARPIVDVTPEHPGPRVDESGPPPRSPDGAPVNRRALRMKGIIGVSSQ